MNEGKENIETEKLIKERKERLISFFKNKQAWVIAVLIVAIVLGVYIRSLPMLDHGGRPGLWDITTNDWTLGPDLDPWLFTRYAQTIVEGGSLPKIDTMRNVPLGFDTSQELQMTSYMIVLTYKIVNLFGNYGVLFTAALMPVLFFALTIISFFLFVREIFIRKEKESSNKANIIALISTFFMIVIPVFLSRTLAGIPEKESVAFFFMFLAFYLFLKSWKSEKIKISIILAILTGISTALMNLSWGGVVYIYVAIGIFSFVSFILGKIKKKEAIVLITWFLVAQSLFFIFSNRTSIKSILTSTSNLILILTLFSIFIHFLMWKTKLKINYLERLSKKIPKNIISLIIAILLGIVLVSLIFGIDFIPDKITGIIETFIKPTTGRWNTTVAENRQPYFTEWAGSFGPYLKNIPIIFWLFFFGSVFLFKEMTNNLNKKDSWILTGLYVFFFFGLVFSRYAPHPAILDGEGFISRIFYFGSALLLIGFLVYYYIKYYRQKSQSFEEIWFGYLFLFSLFVLTLFTARSAVRLIMVLGPVALIFVGYLIVKSFDMFKKTKEESAKLFTGIFLILILLLSMFSFYTYYNQIKSEAYSMVPSYYNQQWQKAMDWTRKETPKDAVFAHWWDYGYWVQSMGNRATVLDGGNAISFWNYYMGRHVLTGNNEKEALDFLYSHNASYLLIDSSDIGKYGAFSSIGSDENYDRYSWIGAFLLDERQTQETKNQTVLVYTGGVALDEDLIIEENGKEIFLPAQKTGIGAIILPLNSKKEFEQPYIIAIYQGSQYKTNLRYLSINENFIDFKSGIEAAVYLFPKITQNQQGLEQNPLGAAMFLSPRLMRGMLTQIYILNDPFYNFPNFRLAHSEPNLIIDSLNQQGMSLPELVYYQGIQGPIKIWGIEYTGSEQIKQEYLDTDSTKYLNWKL